MPRESQPAEPNLVAASAYRGPGMGPRSSGDGPITVLLVEDHLILAESFAALLKRDPLIEVVGIASTAGDAVALGRLHEPDIVLMDIRLPDGSGIEAATTIRTISKRTAFIFLTAYDSVEALGQAVEAGAAAFLPKSEASETVVEAIKRVAAGEMLIEPGKIQHALAWHRQRRHQERERQAVLAAITHREMDVLRLLTDGVSTAAIATALHISSVTVKTHVRSLLAKLDAHSQLQAVAKAQTLGIVQANSRLANDRLTT